MIRLPALTFLFGLILQAVFAQTSPITFRARTDLPNSEQSSVVLADVNNDGILDIVAWEGIQVWLGNGDGTFNALPIQQFANIVDETGTKPASATRNSAPLLFAADINGDGNLDIGFNPSTNQIIVALGNGDGTLQNTLVKHTISAQPLSIAAADVNGDGYPDIVAGTYDGTVELLVNDGKGNFQVQTLYQAIRIVGAVAIRDVNGDKIPDIVFGLNGAVKVLLGAGQGAFLPPTTIAVKGLPGSLLFADFDSDGKVDLAVGGSAWVQSSSQITILHGDGAGNFGNPEIIAAPGVTQIAVGDVNHDGHPDLVVLENNPDVVGVFINKGDGTFRVSANYSAVADAADVALGSLRNNGLLDVVVTGVIGLEVSVLLNKGFGTYQDGSRISLPAQPTQLITADFNGDGLDDLAAVENGAVQIYLATGKKYQLFSAGQSFPLNAVSLISGDFNHDGNADLAFTNSNNQIGIVFGDGSGGFGVPIYTAPGGIVNPYNFQICAGDFNGDGKLDLATS